MTHRAAHDDTQMTEDEFDALLGEGTPVMVVPTRAEFKRLTQPHAAMLAPTITYSHATGTQAITEWMLQDLQTTGLAPIRSGAARAVQVAR